MPVNGFSPLTVMVMVFPVNDQLPVCRIFFPSEVIVSTKVLSAFNSSIASTLGISITACKWPCEFCTASGVQYLLTETCFHLPTTAWAADLLIHANPMNRKASNKNLLAIVIYLKCLNG